MIMDMDGIYCDEWPPRLRAGSLLGMAWKAKPPERISAPECMRKQPFVWIVADCDAILFIGFAFDA